MSWSPLLFVHSRSLLGERAPQLSFRGCMWFGAFPGAFGLGRAQPQRRGSPEARRGSQGASRAAPGKSGLHARGALESLQGLRDLT